MNPRDVVIVGACRTAIGKNMGQFKDVQALRPGYLRWY